MTALGGTTRKWRGDCGNPDRIVFLFGRIIFVELKAGDDCYLSKAQEREHARLKSHGADVITIYGAAGLAAFIKGLARWKDHQESSST